MLSLLTRKTGLREGSARAMLVESRLVDVLEVESESLVATGQLASFWLVGNDYCESCLVGPQTRIPPRKISNVLATTIRDAPCLAARPHDRCLCTVTAVTEGFHLHDVAHDEGSHRFVSASEEFNRHAQPRVA